MRRDSFQTNSNTDCAFPSSRSGALHSAATPPHFICGEAAHFIRRAAAPFIRRAAALFIAAGAGLAAAGPAPAAWRQTDFAADFYRRAAAARDPGENIVLSPWGVAPHFAGRMAGAGEHAARGVAFALQLGGADAPAPDAAAATFAEARTALARASRAGAAVAESGTNGVFRFSAKWDPASAAVAETPFCSALRLPCAGGTFELLAIAPSPSNTLGEVEARLGRAFLDRLETEPRSRPGELLLPRFDLRETLDLDPVLSPMGMAAFFAGNAAGQSLAVVSGEEGVEAAVETGPSPPPLPLLQPDPPPAPEEADSPSLPPPFLFVIRETRTGLVLFLGRVTKP